MDKGGLIFLVRFCVFFFLIVAIPLVVQPATAQTTWYVDDDAPGDPGPGDPTVSDPSEDGSASYPFDAIQEAIDASVTGDTVLVANGTYTGDGNRDMDYGGRNIIVRSSNGPANCIIDCQGSELDPHRGFYFHTDETAEAIVQGFTITNGYRDLSGVTESGGAIQCSEFTSPTIVDNILTGNTARYGGAIFLSRSHSIIDSNVIDGNTATSVGGALAFNYGTLTVTNNEIINNDAEGSYGGGMYFGDSSPTFINNIISGNSVLGLSGGGHGGAMHANASNVTLINNTITTNYADYSGGGISFAPFHEDDMTITNTLIWGNSSPGGSDTVWTRGDDELVNTLHINYSLISGGQPSVFVDTNIILDWGPGNVDANPDFVSGPRGSYYLGQLATGHGRDSVCIDAGSDLASNVCYTNHESTVCFDALTTRMDGVGDDGQVDIGYHYPHAETIYVPDDHPTIQIAINYAHDDDLILVRAGTYLENLDFLGKSITLRSEDGPDVTTIDGGGAGSVVTFSGGTSPSAVVDGFTITNGLAVRGAGFNCDENTTALIVNNIIEGNHATDMAGGIYGNYWTNLTILNNRIIDNTTNFGGGVGGLYSNMVLENNLIAGNDVYIAGGLYFWAGTQTIDFCTIEGNSASGQSGGMHVDNGASVTVTNSIFWNDTAPTGPEISLLETHSPVTVNVDYTDVQGGILEIDVSPGSTLNWGAGNLDADPLFTTGPNGSHCLGQLSAGQPADSPCLDAGDDLAESICFTAGSYSFCLDELTTRSDRIIDAGTADMGYHYGEAMLDAFVWTPAISISSGIALETALTSLGQTCHRATALPEDLSIYRMVYGCLGIWSGNEVLSIEDGDRLADYLDGGGFLYMEGGDTFAWDTPTAVHPYFHINGLSDGGNDCGPVGGVGAVYTFGMSFDYTGGNVYMDRIEPESGAFSLLQNEDPVYVNCIAYDGGGYRTIGCAFEFGGLVDGSSPNTKEKLLEIYLEFFNNGFAPAETTSVSYTCSPGSGTLPMTTQMSLSLDNIHPTQTRRLGAQLNVSLANGSYISSWRAGYTNLTSGAAYESNWIQNLPAIGTLVGTNQFQLLAQDVTPPPYNQPPYAAAGDTASESCTVICAAP